MSVLRKGLILAAVQVLLITAVGAKLLIDRARYPNVWVETAPYDPDSPLRGRYVRFLAVVEPGGNFPDEEFFFQRGRLEIREDKLVGIPDSEGPLNFRKGFCRQSRECVVLDEPLAFFITEDIDDPSIRPEGEELWARVTVPPHGEPRPIELGVRKDGELTPLDV